MINLSDYPRLPNETDDAPRIQRAIDDAELLTVYIPEGTYEIASPLIIKNQASIQMENQTVIECVKEMDFMLEWIGPEGVPGYSRNCAVRGGCLNAKGLASCMKLMNYCHFTIADINFRSGKKYGLCLSEEGRGVECFCNNAYFSNTEPGLQGNTAIYVHHTDAHFTDCVVVDYTYGVWDCVGGGNRFTRIHVWVGAMQVDGEPQYIKGSINFVLKAPVWGECVLQDCYADTGEIGFDIYSCARLHSCAYFNNYDWLKFDNVLAIRNNSTDSVQIFDGCWTKTSPHAKFYEGNPHERVEFRGNLFFGGLEPNHPAITGA